MNNNIAVLITCYNRKIKTLKCLQNLNDIDFPKNIDNLDVYLVDDASTDGTYNAVKNTFPKVKLIKGSGDLFWNHGMRLAWEEASQTKEYDFYLWLNDDVVLEQFALEHLFDCYKEALKLYKNPAIITGAFKNTKLGNEFSYGGRIDSGNVIPNGKLQECKYINGNAVLVSKQVYNKLGNLSSDYTHTMGDFDYGLRALEAGFNNCTTKRYIGFCPVNDSPDWSNPNVPLKERLKLFKSPTGLSYKEYIVFRKKFWGNKWVVFAFKAYMKVMFPSFYKKLKK